jgi:hypothetical protein
MKHRFKAAAFASMSLGVRICENLRESVADLLSRSGVVVGAILIFLE